MSENTGNSEKPKFALIVAIIGAVATVITACVTGFFAMLPALIDRLDKDPVPQTVVVVVTTAGMAQAAAPDVVDTPVPTSTLTPTHMPSATEPLPSPTAAAGLLFASKIAANGLALDPGSEFEVGITDLYVVFPAGMAPPGTFISVDNPQPGSYYAFLQVEQGNSLSRMGWRWIYEGTVVNDYEMDVAAGNDIWLSYSNPQEGGIFGTAPFGAGKYTVVVTLGGNSLISADLLIRP